MNIPFGNLSEESVLVRGAVEDNGYEIMEPSEILGSYILRGIQFEETTFLEKIYITREKFSVGEVRSPDFHEFFFNIGDEIDIHEDKAVFVAGFVKNPGRYHYFMGFSTEDYIGAAGGNLEVGDPKRANIQLINLSEDRGFCHTIQRVDVIYVHQRRLNKLVGELSILQIISYTDSIYLTYRAAQNK